MHNYKCRPIISERILQFVSAITEKGDELFRGEKKEKEDETVQTSIGNYNNRFEDIIKHYKKETTLLIA